MTGSEKSNDIAIVTGSNSEIFQKFWKRYEPYMSLVSPAHFRSLSIPGTLPGIASLIAENSSITHDVMITHGADGKPILFPCVRVNDQYHPAVLGLKEVGTVDISSEKAIQHAWLVYEIATTIAGGTPEAIDSIQILTQNVGGAQAGHEYEYHEYSRKMERSYRSRDERKLDDARASFMENPKLFLAFLVDRAIWYMERLQSGEPDAALNDEMEQFIVWIQKVNLGNQTDQSDRIYYLINDAYVYIKDLYSSQYSHAFAIGQEVIERKIGLPHSMRFNSVISTQAIQTMFSQSEMISDKVFNRAKKGGNIKSAGSLVTETINRRDDMRLDILRLAQRYGIAFDSKLKRSSAMPAARSRETMKVLDKVIKYAMTDKDVARVSEVRRLVENMTQQMNGMEYFLRCNIYFDEPEDFDTATIAAEHAVASYPEHLRKLHNGIQTKVLAAVDEIARFGFYSLDTKSIRDTYGNSVHALSSFMFDFLRRIPTKEAFENDDFQTRLLRRIWKSSNISPFINYYLHLPIRLEIRAGSLVIESLSPDQLAGETEESRVYFEAEMNIGALEALNGIHRLLWEMRSHGIPTALSVPVKLLFQKLREAHQYIIDHDHRLDQEKRHIAFKLQYVDAEEIISKVLNSE